MSPARGAADGKWRRGLLAFAIVALALVVAVRMVARARVVGPGVTVVAAGPKTNKEAAKGS
jgi:hypothetical protein